MIGRIISKSRSVDAILDYNENKVARGVACAVAYRNMPGTEMYQVDRTFSERERHPFLNRKSRNMFVHFTLCRSETDGTTDEDMVRLFNGMLDDLGYGATPAVIYRHEDIDRAHYHGVVCAVLEDGKLVDQKNERWRILEYLHAHEEEFNYKVGIDEEKMVEKPEPKVVPRFDYSKGSTTPQLRAIVRDAMKYNIEEAEQIYPVCFTKGVKAVFRERRRTQGYVLMVQGMTERDHTCTTLYNAERDLGMKDANERFIRQLEVSKRTRPDLVMDNGDFVGLLSDYLLDRCRNEEEFRMLMTANGAEPVFGYAPGDRRRETITDVSFVMPQRRLVLGLKDTFGGHLSIERFNRVKKEVWTAGKERRPAPVPMPDVNTVMADLARIAVEAAERARVRKWDYRVKQRHAALEAARQKPNQSSRKP